MLLRHLVEVVHVQLAPVLHLGVVEEIAFDPGSRRAVGSSCESCVLRDADAGLLVPSPRGRRANLSDKLDVFGKGRQE